MAVNLQLNAKPVEQLKLLGVDNLSNLELLSVILNSQELAFQVLSIEESGIYYLPECTLEELSKIKGMGPSKASVLIAGIELGKRISTKPKSRRINVKCSQDLADYFMADMRYLKNECFKVLLLNTKSDVIAVESVSKGIINSAVVDPREVFRSAIKHGAMSLVLAHNHPSGNPEPSSADLDVTIRLIDSGRLLGIRVVDHIIIGDGEFVSMRQRNIF